MACLGDRTRSTSSYVSFTEIERLIGHDANRFIDCKLAVPFGQSDVELWSDKMLSDASCKHMIQVHFMGEQKKFHPEEVSSMVLTKTKETNEAYLRNKMNDAAPGNQGYLVHLGLERVTCYQ